MKLTMEALAQMHLPEEIAEAILEMHEKETQELSQGLEELEAESAELKERAAQAQEALEKDRSERAKAEAEETLRHELRRELLALGAPEAALGLLVMSAQASGEEACGEKGAQELAQKTRERYPAFFAKPVRIPTDRIQPPGCGEAGITARALERMSTDEINENWNAVKAALKKGV